jgi:hypothetical protein
LILFFSAFSFCVPYLPVFEIEFLDRWHLAGIFRLFNLTSQKHYASKMFTRPWRRRRRPGLAFRKVPANPGKLIV